MKSTTIKISKRTWRRLNALKYTGDSFDDVLERLIDESDLRKED